MYTQCVLALLALYAGLAHCFSWDIVLGGKNGLNFYYNGTLTSFEYLPADNVSVVLYDPVHNRVLFTHNSTIPVISSFDITTKNIQNIASFDSSFPNDLQFAYDPVTETVFQLTETGLYMISFKPGLNSRVGGGSVIFMNRLYGIAVDSCAGYIYWTTCRHIGRIRFDGTENEVLIESTVNWRRDLAIDQQTRRMYWIDKYTNTYDYVSIESANLFGLRRKTLYYYREQTSSFGGSITVSKDFIYWRLGLDDIYWRLPKNSGSDTPEPKSFSIDDAGICYRCDSIAANYKVQDQTQGTRTCEALKRLLPSSLSNVSTDISPLNDNSTHIIEESDCKCTQGYTGERCNVSICQNYCFQGDCCVSDEQPKCRCNSGYSGERCEAYGCQGYCLQGNCSISTEGHPICRCNAGYSGERCEVNACQGYCSKNGVCFINKDNEPVCHCKGDYEGDRCDVSVSVFLMKCLQTVSTMKDILNSDVTGNFGQRSLSTVV